MLTGTGDLGRRPGWATAAL